MRLRFDYIDNEGRISTRTVRDVEIKTEVHIIAFCEMRNEDRTFNMLKMQNIFDLDTNKQVDDIHDYLGMLDEDGELKEKYENYEMPVVALDCKNCGAGHELTHRWLSKNSRFICDCGQSYTIAANKK